MFVTTGEEFAISYTLSCQVLRLRTVIIHSNDQLKEGLGYVWFLFIDICLCKIYLNNILRLSPIFWAGKVRYTPFDIHKLQQRCGLEYQIRGTEYATVPATEK